MVDTRVTNRSPKPFLEEPPKRTLEEGDYKLGKLVIFDKDKNGYFNFEKGDSVFVRGGDGLRQLEKGDASILSELHRVGLKTHRNKSRPRGASLLWGMNLGKAQERAQVNDYKLNYFLQNPKKAMEFQDDLSARFEVVAKEAFEDVEGTGLTGLAVRVNAAVSPTDNKKNIEKLDRAILERNQRWQKFYSEHKEEIPVEGMGNLTQEDAEQLDTLSLITQFLYEEENIQPRDNASIEDSLSRNQRRRFADCNTFSIIALDLAKQVGKADSLESLNMSQHNTIAVKLSSNQTLYYDNAEMLVPRWFYETTGLIGSEQSNPPWTIITTVLNDQPSIGTATFGKFGKLSAQIDQDDPNNYAAQGIAALRAHNPEKAKEYFEEALKINQNDVESNYELGILYKREGSLEKAATHFRKVAESKNIPSWLSGLVKIKLSRIERRIEKRQA